MKPQTSLPNKYYSRGRKISRSLQHHDMWIIENAEGTKFHTITSSAMLMEQNFPPDPAPERKVVRKPMAELKQRIGL